MQCAAPCCKWEAAGSAFLGVAGSHSTERFGRTAYMYNKGKVGLLAQGKDTTVKSKVKFLG